MDSVFHALADPTRRAIVEELASRDDQTLFELCVRLITDRGKPMTRQAVSKHISVLKDAGLVTVTKVGRTTIHHLDSRALADARAWIDTIERQNP